MAFAQYLMSCWTAIKLCDGTLSWTRVAYKVLGMLSSRSRSWQQCKSSKNDCSFYAFLTGECFATRLGMFVYQHKPAYCMEALFNVKVRVMVQIICIFFCPTSFALLSFLLPALVLKCIITSPVLPVLSVRTCLKCSCLNRPQWSAEWLVTSAYFHSPYPQHTVLSHFQCGGSYLTFHFMPCFCALFAFIC